MTRRKKLTAAERKVLNDAVSDKIRRLRQLGKVPLAQVTPAQFAEYYRLTLEVLEGLKKLTDG